MIRLTNISKEFVQKKLFENINLEINPKDKIGLIGANGVGKTTLMKILVKQENIDTGTLFILSGTILGYLSQELPKFTQKTLVEEVKNTFPEIIQLQVELNEIEKKLETTTDDAKLSEIIKHYSFIEDELNRLDAKNKEIEMFKILKGLGFSDNDFERKLDEFSGGWQMRIGLAKLLLLRPNLLLLDEPTNHLDINAIEWLEAYLKRYEGALLIISHDRRFLDRVINKIIELENYGLAQYAGNYSQFEIAKEKGLETLFSAYERQQKEINRVQEFIDRFRAKATKASQVKSREKMLDKLERIEIPKSSESIKFKFPSPPQTGRVVLKMRNLVKNFEDLEVLNIKTDIWVERGSKIALIGDNGCGKTTLVRLITKEYAPNSGDIEFGHHVIVSYFSQNQAKELSSDKIVLDEIYDLVPNYSLTEVRNLLGRFLFRGEKAFQDVNSLSGGEKSRLAIAKMLLKPANFMLLDEPTNHLDIPSKEVLINALQEFSETFMVVSHDRDFISRTCNKIFEISNKTIKVYEGNYDLYLEEKAKEKELELNSNTVDNIQNESENEIVVKESKEYRIKTKEKQKQVTAIERNILRTEEKIKILENELANPEVFNNQKFAELGKDYKDLQIELEKYYEKWEELHLD